VLIAIFSGDSIINRRTTSTWATWVQTALKEVGFHVAVLAQTARSEPFPVLGTGGSEGAKGPVQVSQILSGYKILLERYQRVQWIFKVDDDTYVHTPRLWRLLERGVPRPDGFAILGDCKAFCGGGSGYLMHRTTLEAISRASGKCSRCQYAHDSRAICRGSDGVTSHCILATLHGRLINHEGFYHWPPSRLTRNLTSGDRIGACRAAEMPPFAVAAGWITHHHVSPMEMQELHAAVQAAAAAAQAAGRAAPVDDMSCVTRLVKPYRQASERCAGLLCPVLPADAGRHQTLMRAWPRLFGKASNESIHAL